MAHIYKIDPIKMLEKMQPAGVFESAKYLFDRSLAPEKTLYSNIRSAEFLVRQRMRIRRNLVLNEKLIRGMGRQVRITSYCSEDCTLFKGREITITEAFFTGKNICEFEIHHQFWEAVLWNADFHEGDIHVFSNSREFDVRGELPALFDHTEFISRDETDLAINWIKGQGF